MAIHLTAAAAEGASGVPLHHFWNEVAGAGRAAEGLRADWQGQLAHVVDTIGYRYLRFHGVFHDDMFVYREIDGEVAPYFQYVDLLFDRMQQLGIRPFVEFGFMPAALARDTKTCFWWGGNGAPPTDLGKWNALVDATVRHWVARYGIDEVRQWYFEVWNEPNLAPFFAGTRSEYFELYRETVQTVKAVDARLRVGGPATSNFVPDARFDGEMEDLSQHAVVLEAKDLSALTWKPVWVELFLQFCADEGLPVDFVSCHPYPTDWALDEHGQGAKLTREIAATPTDLRLLRSIVDRSAFPDAEIHLTEWSSSSSSRDHTHDAVQAATFIVKTNLESIGLADSLSYWTFTDIFEEEGAGQAPFHGGFGVVTQHGIQKPSFHAYRFLALLGDELLAQTDGGVLTRFAESGEVSGLFYHYPPEEPLSVPASFDGRGVADATLAKGSSIDLEVVVAGLVPGGVYELEVVDRTHGDVVAAWREAGEPLNLTVPEADTLRAAGRATRRQGFTVDADGSLVVSATLGAWAIASLHPLRQTTDG